MPTPKPNLNRVWAGGAPPSNVIDPDSTTPGKFAAGWLAEVPPFEHFNFLQQLFTQGLAHNNEQGINEWDISTSYPVGALVKASDSLIYKCVIAGTGNDPVGDIVNWEDATNSISYRGSTLDFHLSLLKVADYAEAKAIPSNQLVVGETLTISYRANPGDEGGTTVEVVDPTLFASLIALDTSEIEFIKFNDDPTPTDKVMRKTNSVIITPEAAGVDAAAADSAVGLQATFDYAMSKYARQLGSPLLGGSFPAMRATVRLPPKHYKSANTLTINQASLACFELVAEATSTLEYTGTGGALLYARPDDALLNIMSTRCTIKRLRAFKRDKSAGSVALDIERMTNCLIEEFSTYGFDYAVQINGGIDNLLDFRGQAIEACNVGIQIQQKTAPPGGIMKPNLTSIKNLFLINCATNGIVIRKNPAESPTNNGAGGLIELDRINFLTNSSGPALLVESPGETPGRGAVKCGTLWFEGHGNTAISLQDGIITIDKLFIMNGSDPIILQDSTSKIVINELEAYFSVIPTENCVIRRADGTTDGLEKQVIVRNAQIHVDGIPGVNLTKDRTVLNTSSYFEMLQTDRIWSERGDTGSVAGSGGTSSIFDMGAEASNYQLFVRQTDGGIVWRCEASIFHNGAASTSIDTRVSSNITVSSSGTNIVLTNVNASAQSFSWTLLRVLV